MRTSHELEVAAACSSRCGSPSSSVFSLSVSAIIITISAVLISYPALCLGAAPRVHQANFPRTFHFNSPSRRLDDQQLIAEPTFEIGRFLQLFQKSTNNLLKQQQQQINFPTMYSQVPAVLVREESVSTYNHNNHDQENDLRLNNINKHPLPFIYNHEVQVPNSKPIIAQQGQIHQQQQQHQGQGGVQNPGQLSIQFQPPHQHPNSLVQLTNEINNNNNGNEVSGSLGNFLPELTGYEDDLEAPRLAYPNYGMRTSANVVPTGSSGVALNDNNPPSLAPPFNSFQQQPPQQELPRLPPPDDDDPLNFIGTGAEESPEPGIPRIRLVPMNVYTKDVTISGFSSGGAFVQQLLISHPSLFKGIGIFHQTFYRCGGGGGVVEDFDFFCTQLPSNYTQPREGWDPQIAINDIGNYYRQGLIENPANLVNKRVYIYAGLRNEVFSIEMMMNTIKVLEPFIRNPDVIKTRVQDSQNLLPTNHFGLPCSQSAVNNFLIGNCNLNGAYEALSWIIGSHARLERPRKNDRYDLNSFVSFDQTEFFEEEGISTPHFMANEGYAYVPAICSDGHHGKCLFHVYFHGCRSGSDFLGTNHIRNSGYLELAEINGIIMLFPQVTRVGQNYLGCWDSYGVTGNFYATQQGIQIRIVRRMIERIIDGGGGGATNSARAGAPQLQQQQQQQRPRRRTSKRQSCTQTISDISTLYLCQVQAFAQISE